MQQSDQTAVLPNLLYKKKQIAELLEQIRLKKEAVVKANQKMHTIQNNLAHKKNRIRTLSRYQKDINRLNVVLEEVQRSVESMSILQLNEITKYNNPPEVIKIAIEGILFLLRGKKLPWIDLRKEIAKSNFIKEVLRFKLAKADPELVKTIQDQYILTDKWNLDRLKKASKAMGPLGEWLQCQVELYDASTKSADAAEYLQIHENVGELEENKHLMESIMEENEAEAEELELQVAQLQEEVEELEILVSNPDVMTTSNIDKKVSTNENNLSFVTKRVRFAENSSDLMEERMKKMSVIRNSEATPKKKPKFVYDNFLYVQRKRDTEEYFKMFDFKSLEYYQNRLKKTSFAISPPLKFNQVKIDRFCIEKGTDKISVVHQIEMGTERISMVTKNEEGTGFSQREFMMDKGTGKISLYNDQLERGVDRLSLDEEYMKIMDDGSKKGKGNQSGKNELIEKGTFRMTVDEKMDKGIFKMSNSSQLDNKNVSKISISEQNKEEEAVLRKTTGQKNEQDFSKNSLLNQNDKNEHKNFEVQQNEKKDSNHISSNQNDTETEKMSIIRYNDQGSERISLLEFQKKKNIYEIDTLNTIANQKHNSIDKIETGTKMSINNNNKNSIPQNSSKMSENEQKEENLSKSKKADQNITISSNLNYQQNKVHLEKNEIGVNKRTLSNSGLKPDIENISNEELNLKTTTQLTTNNVYHLNQDKQSVEKYEIGISKMTFADNPKNPTQLVDILTTLYNKRASESRVKTSSPNEMMFLNAEEYIQSTSDNIINQIYKQNSKNTFLQKTIFQNKAVQTDFSDFPLILNNLIKFDQKQLETSVFDRNSTFTAKTITDKYQEQYQTDFDNLKRKAENTKVYQNYNPVLKSSRSADINNFVENRSSEVSLRTGVDQNQKYPIGTPSMHKIGIKFENYNFAKSKLPNQIETNVKQEVNLMNLTKSENVFLTKENRISKSLPRTGAYSYYPNVFSGNIDSQLNNTIYGNEKPSITHFGRSIYDEGSAVLRREFVKVQNDEMSVNSGLKMNLNKNRSIDKMSLIAIEFVDKDTSQLTDRSFSISKKIDGPRKVVMESEFAPLVSVVKNRDTFQIKSMLVQNPNLKLEDLNNEKYSVSYRFVDTKIGEIKK